VSCSWQAERGSRRTRRHPRDDPCAKVGEEVRVVVGVRVRVGPMEFHLYDVVSPIHKPLLIFIRRQSWEISHPGRRQFPTRK